LQRKFIIAFAMSVLVGGCTAVGGADGVASQQPEAVPEAVVEMAAPYQDVSTARVLPEDGCYWYSHSGPVETTLLPLRTVDGRPICTARE